MKIILAEKSEKKEILRFYKNQYYSARFLGFDRCYCIKVNDEIIASVMISNIIENSEISFLHALVVGQAWQHQGLASQLIVHVTKIHPSVICFADEKLANLYTKNQMVVIEKPQFTELLPEHLMIRLKTYQNKQPQLKVFRY